MQLTDATLQTIIASKGEGVPPQIVVEAVTELLRLRKEVAGFPNVSVADLENLLRQAHDAIRLGQCVAGNIERAIAGANKGEKQ